MSATDGCVGVCESSAMPASCCALGCSNSVAQGKRLFRIPMGARDAVRRQLWLALIKRPDFVPTSGSRLCEDHFSPEQFEQRRADGRRLLKQNAVPSIPPSSSAVSQEKGKRRPRRSRRPATKRGSKNYCQDSSDDDTSDGEEEEEEAVENPSPTVPTATTTTASTNVTSQLDSPVADWADMLTRKALQIRLASGQRGYTALRQMCAGFPSEHQLRECAGALPFRAGLLEGLLPALECKVSTMVPVDRHAVLCMDRVPLRHGGPEPSTLVEAGANPEPSGDALVFTLAGLASRWKQTLGYHLLPASACTSLPCALAFADKVREVAYGVIRNCEALGLIVEGLVTDLCPATLSVWQQCGVSTRAVRRPVFAVPHPCCTDEQPTETSEHRRLAILADAPYIMKSVMDALVQSETLHLPEDALEKYRLPSEKVCFDHVRSLFERNAAGNLGVVNGVSLDFLEQGSSVEMSSEILSRSAATASRCLRAVDLLPEVFKTTAWFVEQMDRWFSLVTSPTLGPTPEQRNDALAFLNGFKDLFSRISLPSSQALEATLRAAQVGLCVSTVAMLHLRDAVMSGLQSHCVLTCRQSSDLPQNVLRAVLPTTSELSPSGFQSSLHTVALSQLFLPVQSGRLRLDEGAEVADFVDLAPSKCNDKDSCLLTTNGGESVEAMAS